MTHPEITMAIARNDAPTWSGRRPGPGRPGGGCASAYPRSPPAGRGGRSGRGEFRTLNSRSIGIPLGNTPGIPATQLTCPITG
jgi:hypothetical protein